MSSSDRAMTLPMDRAGAFFQSSTLPRCAMFGRSRCTFQSQLQGEWEAVAVLLSRYAPQVKNALMRVK